jgi:hypothetical protein
VFGDQAIQRRNTILAASIASHQDTRIIMVRVWYEPPPFGPGTDLNRSGYGVHGGGLMRKLLERASKMPQLVAIGAPTLVIMAVCWIPLSTYI